MIHALRHTATLHRATVGASLSTGSAHHPLDERPHTGDWGDPGNRFVRGKTRLGCSVVYFLNQKVLDSVCNPPVDLTVFLEFGK